MKITHSFLKKKFLINLNQLMTLDENVVFTCGSGVTASVLALAYSLIDIKYMPIIYDGSWSEYGIKLKHEKINKN